MAFKVLNIYYDGVIDYTIDGMKKLEEYLNNGYKIINTSNTSEMIIYILEKKENNKNKKEINEDDVKHKRGEFGHVKLSNNQLNKLKNEFGDFTVMETIREVDEYVEQIRGKPYKNDVLAIKNFIKKDNEKNNKPKNKKTIFDDITF